jgi:hypothetical protein
MSEFYEDQAPAWDNTYLLGWEDREGKSYLTTWDGDLPMVHVVVTGCNGINMPLWDAPVPDGAQLHRVPDDDNPKEYARKIGGFYAFGWRVPVKRKEPKR